VFEGCDDWSYNTVSELDCPRIVFLLDLLTGDVSAPGGGADLLRAINAPDTHLDGFRAHHFEGHWEESLTESLSVTVRRLSAR
jgi:hypothetical protein